MIRNYRSEKVRAASIEDIEHLSNNMRAADVNEVWSSHRHTPEMALTHSFLSSAVSWTIVYENEPVAMFGVSVTSLLSKTGVPWILGTDKIKDVYVEFLRHSHYYVGQMLKHRTALYNFVDARNIVSIRWLKWCGFKMLDPIVFGFDGLNFYPFVMEAKYHV